MWYLNIFLLLNDLSQKLQGASTSVWTSRMCWLSLVSLENCFPQKVQTSSELIFLKYVVVLVLLGWLAETDWPLRPDDRRRWPSNHGRIFSLEREKLRINWVPKFSSLRHLILAKSEQGALSNGHSVAPIFGQNHVNASLYMVISPKNRCHKPSWQGFRPPAPNGQCPNELLYFYGGASLIQRCKKSKN